MYSLRCTLYSVQCAMYRVLRIVNYAHCTSVPVYTVLCTVYSVECRVYSVLCTVYSVQCSSVPVYIALYTVYGLQRSSVKCTAVFFKLNSTSLTGTIHLPDYEPFKTHPLLAAPLAVICKTSNFWLFNFIQHNPSREPNSSSASQKTTCTFGNPKVHYRVHIRPPFLPSLNHMDAFHTLLYHLRHILIL